MADSPDLDRYEAYYTGKLWKLLPAVYRAEDSPDFDRPGPLAELVARVGVQAAILRRSIDRLWEDQSIETCDDWLIPYIGDLLATNLVTRLDARGQRVDVAKTIYYRRRKGTVALLEELATDITGWRARVVEFFRRLARTRHGLDPPVGFPVRSDDARFALQRSEGLIGARTHTGAGGLADLRDVHGAAMTDSAFDEYFHTADVRRGRGKTGWYDIPRLGVFVWRLESLLVKKVTPVKDARCTQTFTQYTFDPTGRDVPLFAAMERPLGDQWVSPEPQQLPGPITADLLELAFDDLYPDSLGVYYPLGDDYTRLAADQVARDPRKLTTKPWIDPERGRIVWPGAPGDPAFRVDYHYGFSSEIGAGPYTRPLLTAPADPVPTTTTLSDPAKTVTATRTRNVNGAPRIDEIVVIGNSLTYETVGDVGPIARVVLRAKDQERPLIRPHVAAWTFTGAEGAELTLDGIFLGGGCDLVLSGSFERVTLSCCTLDPGSWDSGKADWQLAADHRSLEPTRLRIEGSVRELIIDRCITGPILAEDALGRVESLTVRDSIIQAADPRPGVLALSLADGDVTLSRCTLLGAAQLHRLDASECILHDIAEVADRQHGCVRFSAWAAGSRIPRQYESVMETPRAPLFVSRDFGRPEYAQLTDIADRAVIEGAEDGSEMGAFCREKSALKERALLIKYQEYLPLGLEPVVIHVT